METPQAVILRDAITVRDHNGSVVNWERDVEPHFLLLQQVAAAAGMKEDVFSSVKWALVKRTGNVFESVQGTAGRCQTVITHSSAAKQAHYAADSLIEQVSRPVAPPAPAPASPASGQGTETGEGFSEQLSSEFYDRLDEDLVESALNQGVPPWILSLLNACVGTVVECLCDCQLLSMKGSLMYFDPKGTDVVLPQPAHIDYEPDTLYFPFGGKNKRGSSPRMLPASVFIFSFSNQYNLSWWKDFCGPQVLKKIGALSPFGEDGPCARSVIDWMTDPAFTNSKLRFGDILWMDGSMVHAGAPFPSFHRNPVFRLHVFACARDQSAANSLGKGVDADTFFVQMPGSLSHLFPNDPIPKGLESKMKKHL